MKFRLALATLAVFLAPLAAEAETRFERRYYDIHASDALELYAGITSRSPLGTAAWTEVVPTSARWEAKRVGNGYVIARLDLHDLILQTLPRWADQDRAPACLQREWDRALSALIRHEDVHAQKYAEYSRRFRQEAMRIPPQPTPQALQQALSDLKYRLEAETNAWQEDYDRRTDHGRLEGVVIRPC